MLDEILTHKRAEVAERIARVPRAALAERAHTAPPARDFRAALSRPGVSIIAEIKRQSPAKGALRLDMDAPTMARTYAAAGAAAISVLTDERYFNGSDADLVAVRQAVDVPILRKDFVVDPYQVYEARTLGADAILLIVRALNRNEIVELSALADSLGMAALVEAHTAEEVAVALDAGATLVGINNRDLTRMVVDVATTERLRPLVPSGVTLVSESGIRSADDIARLRTIGVDAALVGEALVTAPDAGELLRSLIAAGRSPAEASAPR
ncbi:MAG: indole-3-glycerol phosphate synthase TrpC [Chloroflexota bacterium]|nr:indole-3-glycerol phosphate synthase TrpC [Chloroflexota bacterium]